ncbi:MAG TPA: hypothetical protein VFM05_08360 [Candidatus Saccharimonadales bacterium]|nr:hypothetical protein [Candidatus Saccharimonadales bacterium]
MIERLFIAISSLTLLGGVSFAQKGTADPDYYPLGYSGHTWTGEVIAFDNERRTLTLTHSSGDKVLTFIASIPDAPYEWRRDARNFRVVDFPYDKQAKYQVFKYMGLGKAASVLPGGLGSGTQTRPSPPASNVITEFDQFKGRRITVYYTTREREVEGRIEKYNDVWRIRILDTGKKK